MAREVVSLLPAGKKEVSLDFDGHLLKFTNLDKLYYPDDGFTKRDVLNYYDRVADLHLWRLGPGHLGAIVTVATREARTASYYRNRLAGFPSLSHLTIEVAPIGKGA